MLKKKNRLASPREVKGEFFYSPLFDVKIAKSGEKNTRFAFVVSKKINKSAVLRNRTKRVLQQSIKALLEKILPEKNLIVFPKSTLSFEDKERVEKTLLQIFKKAKIIK